MPPHRPQPRRTTTYIWQRPDWPQWRFDAAAIAASLAQVHRAQGHLAGRMAELGLAQRDQATLQALISAGANLQLTDRQGHTPLQLLYRTDIQRLHRRARWPGRSPCLLTAVMMPQWKRRWKRGFPLMWWMV